MKSIIIMSICFTFLTNVLNVFADTPNNSPKNIAILITGDTPTTGSYSPKNWNDGVGINGYGGFDEFWNDTYLMWEMLYKYGFKDENIYVLYGDGDDYFDRGDRYNVTLNFPGEFTEITDYAATVASVNNIFSWLKNGNSNRGIPEMAENDFLFIWTFDHGGSAGNNNSILYLMDGSISDVSFASLADQLDYDKRVVWMQQCFSGGFIDNLENVKTLIATACKGDELAFRADDTNPDGADTRENEITSNVTYHHGEFNYHMLNASNLETITKNDLPAPDTNEDDLSSIDEIFSWEDTKDSQYETPQYSDQGNNGSTVYSDIAPHIPANQSVTGSIGQHPTIHWNDNTEHDLSGYKIYVKYGDGNYGFLTSVDKNTTSFTDPGVIIGGGKFGLWVCYKVSAFDLNDNESDLPLGASCVSASGLSKHGIAENNCSDCIPENTILHNAYPNPFNPVTNISFDIKEESFVNLNVYNIQGQLIANLVNSRIATGYHNVSFNGDQLPSGVYVYKIEVNSQSTNTKYQAIKRMLLIK